MKFELIKKINNALKWSQGYLSRKQFIYLSSVLVGISVGLAAVILKIFVHYIYIAATNNALSSIRYFYIFLPLIGIVLTVFVIKKVLKGSLDKGLSHIHTALAKKAGLIPRKQMYAQILTSSLTVGLGGSAGLEAPIVITGAAFGSNYSKQLNLSRSERTLLLACGIAAGIGCAFDAPIAGVLFALEVLLIDISISAFIPLIISAACGALVSKIILADGVLLSFSMIKPFDYINVPFYILLGISAGLISVYHLRVFSKIERLFNRRPNRVYFNAVLGGLILAVLIFLFPSLFGEGYQSITTLSLQKPENLLNNSYFENFKSNEGVVLAGVGILIFLKAIATAITIGSGGNGGNFAPALFVGAYLGYFLSKIYNMFSVSQLPVSNFTIVGMAGILSGLYHAPLTAIFLIAEITGGYTLMIPLMIVSSISFAVSKYFEPNSMDTKNIADSGDVLTFDRDYNILATIKTENLVETTFPIVRPGDKLELLIDLISTSNRNRFPVVDNFGKLVGIILLDSIRDVIFRTELYDKVSLKELMTNPPETVLLSDSMSEVMKKFDLTDEWNLPVVENGKYIGWISKSDVFTTYRAKLKDSTIL